MNAITTINILNSIIPVSRFNKGEASKIFNEVKNDGIRIVVKNNVPECVLISPIEYQEMVEKYEDALLYIEACTRLSEEAEYFSHKEVLKSLDISEEDLKDIEVELE